MKKTKIPKDFYIRIGVFSLLAIFYLNIISCRKDEKGTSELTDDRLIKDAPIISIIKKAYFLDVFDVKATDLQKNKIISAARSHSLYFNDIFQILDMNNVRLFTSYSGGQTVAVFTFIGSDVKTFGLQGFLSEDKFLILNDLFVDKIIEADGTRTLVILKNNDLIGLNYKNGEEISQDLYLSNKVNITNLVQLNLFDFNTLTNQKINFDDRYGNHGGNGFCQRERNETFAQCYKAEKDEFCSDFFSCIAGDLVPAVSMLIATSCSCKANQSD